MDVEAYVVYVAVKQLGNVKYLVRVRYTRNSVDILSAFIVPLLGIRKYCETLPGNNATNEAKSHSSKDIKANEMPIKSSVLI